MLLQKFKLGIPIRDMRLLDPNLLTSETGKILVRDNAIVFAMEHIRLIISATAVIIPRDGFEQNLLNARFNALLEESIIEASQEKQHRESRLQHLREIAESDFDDDTSSGKLHSTLLLVVDAANRAAVLLLCPVHQNNESLLVSIADPRVTPVMQSCSMTLPHPVFLTSYQQVFP